jgi:hypothetical protein
VLTFFSDADDTEQPYGLYLPKNFDANKKYPLVMMLHGAGSNHRLALRRVFGKSNANGETDVEATRYFPEWNDVDFIVASPYARGTAGYQGIPENDVYAVLADVKKRFPIDEDRVYLTGLSMGGGGTLWIGLTRPDIWAAIAPVCPAPPAGTEAFAPNALNYPVHFFQGGADPVVKPEGTRNWVKKLQDLGTNVAYDEFPGVQHDSWVPAYKDEAIFKWFGNTRRNPFPDRVRFASPQYKYNKAFWVTLDALNPGTTAQIDARFSKSNTIAVTTLNLDGFTLHLAGHPQFKSDQPLELTIDGKKIKVPAGDSVSVSKRNNKWTAGKAESGALAKKQGAEGPIYAAFSNRHVYVYGTRDNPSPEELQRRMDIAVQAGNWSLYRGEFLGRMLFFPRVISDKDVRPLDFETSNLILFGTKETNNIINQFSSQLPLQLDSTNKEYGLFYVYPVDGKYVAVSSGLPWWTGIQEQGFPFVPLAQRGLTDFKDYILFKNSIKHVVAEGYFDKDWKLPAADQQPIITAGVVRTSK